jgi:hypothetical protein
MNAAESLANVEAWSMEEFGGAQLGNRKRTERLVVMASAAAQRPGGKVTDVFRDDAAKQAAFKFLENSKVDEEAIATASHVACARRCDDEPIVFVPVDGSSLSFRDLRKIRGGLGPVGNRSKNGRGLEVMNAIAVDTQGVPRGVCGQVFWARSEQADKRSKSARQTRPLEEKETRFWFEAMRQSMTAFLFARTRSQPWFQLDCGGDFHEMLAWAADNEVYLTTRAAHNRRLETDEAEYLWGHVEEQPALGTVQLDVPGGHGRVARRAKVEVRAAPVTLRLKDKRTQTTRPAALYVVQTREIDVPEGATPLSWTLLTNFEATSFERAQMVAYGYSLRWRVEDFHKSWKSVCKIQESQMREASHVIKWAVILAAVAMRIERLKHLGRKHPDVPATEELSRHEVDATIELRQPKGYKMGDTPPIGLVVRWIADLGGYTGKSSGGPPGALVLARGLLDIATAARLLRIMREK